MQPILFDTSVYISDLRLGRGETLSSRWLAANSPLWLSSVVLEELYAGAERRERRALERLEHDFERLKRIVVPNLSDWTQTGRVLARIATKYDFEDIGRSRLTNDALIAISAGRLGIKLLTTNARDYRRLSEFGVFQWQLIVL